MPQTAIHEQPPGHFPEELQRGERDTALQAGDIVSAHSDEPACDRRIFNRLPVRLEQRNSLVLVQECGRNINAALRDISVGGARVQFLELPPSLEVGEVLTLQHCTLPTYGGKLEGMPVQVVWRQEGQAGLLFEKFLE